MILDNEVYNVLPPLVSECWEINNIRDLQLIMMLLWLIITNSDID